MDDSIPGEKHKIVIPSTPKSMNAMSRGSHWQFSREKKRLEGELFIALLEAKVPKPLTKVYAEACLKFPDSRRRDEGNYRSTLEKALGDVLQLQWLPDDTPEHFTFGPLHFDIVRGRETLIFLAVERA